MSDAIGRVQAVELDDAVRRARDVAGSLLLLALTLPLLLLVACLIKLASRGPVLYRQDRVGLHGRVFTMLKFRTTRIDAEADGPRWTAERDRRVKRFGAFVRASRIDELPQLINVLRGEMSLVGPRPERPYFVEQLARVIPRYDERTRVLPGLTGWAQELSVRRVGRGRAGQCDANPFGVKVAISATLGHALEQMADVLREAGRLVP
jgi:lipopolysaccharide/colanic/teichoic acid biosynthesis glycosyltransferase